VPGLLERRKADPAAIPSTTTRTTRIPRNDGKDRKLRGGIKTTETLKVYRNRNFAKELGTIC
jgi:hypothetical protein